MGGLLGLLKTTLSDVYIECRTPGVVQEGFPTYGGLEGGAMERLVVSYTTACVKIGWSIALVRCSRSKRYSYLHRANKRAVIAFVDAGVTSTYSGGRPPALACELYKVAGIRAVEIGSLLQGRDP